MSFKYRHGKSMGRTLAALASVFVLLLAACGSGDKDPLTQCVDHDKLDSHIHVNLSTVFNGQEEALPAGIGVTPQCMSPTHTHDESSAIHVESPSNQKYTVGDFFDIWGARSPDLREGAVVESVLLNGEPYSGDYRDIEFEDGQRIEVAFGNGRADILTQCITHNDLSTRMRVTLITPFNGQPATVPANIGITSDCMRPVHTHDDSSLVYIEGPGNQQYTVGDFFKVWGEDNPYLGAGIENVSLNGQPYIGDYRDIVFEDGQRIAVAFGNRTPTGPAT